MKFMMGTYVAKTHGSGRNSWSFFSKYLCFQTVYIDLATQTCSVKKKRGGRRNWERSVMGVQGDMEAGSCGGYNQDTLNTCRNFKRVNFKSKQKLFYCFPFEFFLWFFNVFIQCNRIKYLPELFQQHPNYSNTTCFLPILLLLMLLIFDLFIFLAGMCEYAGKLRWEDHSQETVLS